MSRQPHRLIVRDANPPAVLSFWTAQAVALASLAAQAERKKDTALRSHGDSSVAGFPAGRSGFGRARADGFG